MVADYTRGNEVVAGIRVVVAGIRVVVAGIRVVVARGFAVFYFLFYSLFS
jgi:hypothetical protein